MAVVSRTPAGATGSAGQLHSVTRDSSKMTSQPFIAWDIDGNADVPPEVAPVARDWMDATAQRFAYRCLPMVMANQCGWMIHCPIGFTAKWNGGDAAKSIRLWYHNRKRDERVCSHFGHGVLTFSVPWIFQTPPDINLWVKGPANMLKDGIQLLEGLIESDWNETTFTMNWKFTRPDVAVRFEKGEPYCMIVPIHRRLAESLDPVTKPLSSDPERQDRVERWKQSRLAFNAALAANDPEVVKLGWQREYMLGKGIDGQQHPQHQTRLTLRPFRSGDSGPLPK